MVVDVLDSATLQRHQNLESPRGAIRHPKALILSPDGRMLTCSGYSGRNHELRPLVTWSLQTGGVVSAIEALPLLRDPAVTEYHRTTYSTNGKMVGVFRQYETARVDGRIIREFFRGPTFATISIYNVVSGVYLGDVDHDLDSPYIFWIWAHGESLRFATFRQKTITIHEVGFTPEASPTEVKTLPIPDLAGRTAALEMGVPDSAIHVRFLPCRVRPVSVLPVSVDPSIADGALVWDARDPATSSTPNFFRLSFLRVPRNGIGNSSLEGVPYRLCTPRKIHIQH